MKSRVRDHIHKYIRVLVGGRRISYVKDPETGKSQRVIEKVGGYEVFKCMFPGCTHFIPKELALGRISVCWNCGEELLLTPDCLMLKKPTHLQCRKKRVAA